MRKYAERWRISFKSIEKLKGLYADVGKLKTNITRYILSERDTIRDMVVTMVRRVLDPRININTEPDVACPKECPNIMSHDYDVYFLEIGTLLRHPVIAATLCGTDYNTIDQNLEVTKALEIARKDHNHELIDREASPFPLYLHITHAYLCPNFTPLLCLHIILIR